MYKTICELFDEREEKRFTQQLLKITEDILYLSKHLEINAKADDKGNVAKDIEISIGRIIIDLVRVKYLHTNDKELTIEYFNNLKFYKGITKYYLDTICKLMFDNQQLLQHFSKTFDLSDSYIKDIMQILKNLTVQTNLDLEKCIKEALLCH